MAFDLGQVVPWGRSLGEYRNMFALTDDDLAGRVLDCGGGPASFVVEAVESADGDAVAVDPLYAFAANQIERRVSDTYVEVCSQLELNRDDYLWGRTVATTSPSTLTSHRLQTMQAFLADFIAHPSRYVAAALQTLPFEDGAYELALCSHFLFLYDQHADGPFHAESVLEMARVAREVRVFPLLSLGGRPSPFVAEVEAAVQAAGLESSRVKVSYEFQKGGDEMLIVRRSAATHPVDVGGPKA